MFALEKVYGEFGRNVCTILNYISCYIFPARQQIPKDICNGSTSSSKKELSSPDHSAEPSPRGCHSPTPSFSSISSSTHNSEAKNSTCTNDSKSNSFNAQFPSCYTHPPSSPVAPSLLPYVNVSKTDRRIQNICPTNKQLPSAPDKHYYSGKQLFGDQHIKVLTPSEIMKSLPDLSQDECVFGSRMVSILEQNSQPSKKISTFMASIMQFVL